LGASCSIPWQLRARGGALAARRHPARSGLAAAGGRRIPSDFAPPPVLAGRAELGDGERMALQAAAARSRPGAAILADRQASAARVGWRDQAAGACLRGPDRGSRRRCAQRPGGSARSHPARTQFSSAGSTASTPAPPAPLRGGQPILAGAPGGRLHRRLWLWEEASSCRCGGGSPTWSRATPAPPSWIGRAVAGRRRLRCGAAPPYGWRCSVSGRTDRSAGPARRWIPVGPWDDRSMGLPLSAQRQSPDRRPGADLRPAPKQRRREPRQGAGCCRVRRSAAPAGPSPIHRRRVMLVVTTPAVEDGGSSDISGS
jgi:hypothetical protein